MVARMRRLGRLGGAGKSAGTPCIICHGTDTTTRAIYNKGLDATLNAMTCATCGMVSLPENTHDYTESTSTDSLGLAPRCGTEERTGREFGMAQLAVEVLGRNNLSVMVYGVGRSMDNLHIAKMPAVGRTVIGDIMKIRDDAEFIDISGEATETFDIVIACEVIEHFTDPLVDFPKLMGWVAPGGILVCSTNIHDGGPLEGQKYIFGRGHVSYYSPEALRRVAKASGWYVDFRLPIMASNPGPKGVRKRFVIMSKSADVMDHVSDFFGRHPYAPSEPPEPVKKKSAAAPAR